MSIWHPIAELQLYQNLTLKIKGQGQGWRHSSKSQCGSSILSTHIPFVPCQSALPFSRYSILKIWPWKSRVKVMGEVTVQSHNVGLASYRLTSLSFHVNLRSHSCILEMQHFQNLTLKIKGQGHGWGHSSKSQCGSNILSTHIPFVPCQSALPFLRYSIFKIWPWKSMAKVMGEVTVQSHNVGLTSYRLTSLLFHVNRASHSWVMTFSKFDLENQRSRSQSKVTMWV